jgi:hypothetical protein
MNSEDSSQCRCDENVSDSCNHSLKGEEDIQYTPNQKKRKLEHREATTQQSSTALHSQILPHEHFEDYDWGAHDTEFVPRQQYMSASTLQDNSEEIVFRKHHPKCLPHRVSFCSTATRDLYLTTDTSSYAGENYFGSKNTTGEVVVCTLYWNMS